MPSHCSGRIDGRVIEPEAREGRRAAGESVWTAFPREEGMMLAGQGSFYLGRASVSQAWGQGPPAVRLAEPIIDWGLFYRNPKSQWKSRVENPCFSLRHSQYFPSEKTHYVQQRKRQPFPVEWIMRNCNREREGERAHKWQTTQD